jgi:hypothetical protein
VIGDFRDSLAKSGPKLVKLVDAITTQIESLLPELISPSDPDRVASPIASFLQKVMPCGVSNRIARPIDSLLRRLVPRNAATEVTRSYTISDAVRADILRHLARLESELATEAAIIAAWRDLVSSAEKVKRSVEEVSFRATLCMRSPRAETSMSSAALASSKVYAECSPTWPTQCKRNLA